MDYVLGIDGGGTKTACVISDTEGRLLSVGIGGSSNHLVVGQDEAKRSIEASINEALEKCHGKIRKFEVAYLGMAGAGRPSGVKVIKTMMESLGFAKKVLIDIDAGIALAGATACKPGIVVVSGTGSMAFGINKEGERGRVGGWGYLLGDEGSGYDIGRKGLTAALRAYDGREKETVLLKDLMAHFKVDSIDELVTYVYFSRMRIDEVSSLAPLVVKAAREGDVVSQKILRDAVNELSFTAITLAKKLNMAGEEFELAFIGGIFKVKDLVAYPVEVKIKRAAPKCTIIAPKFKPAVGAVLMALKEINIKIEEPLLDSVRATLHNIQVIC